tara:strand:- start:18 stop:680 length:663 start_codon:yes stop_codon:yes gene_type:complete
LIDHPKINIASHNIVKLKFNYLALIITLIVFISCDFKSEPSYIGTLLDNHDSYKFSLKDHSNRIIDSGNHGSNVAILTFMFTECTDVCPILTHNIKKALNEIPQKNDIPIIIISVDPENDSIQNMKQFVKKWDLTSNWSFVTGNSDELDQIWSSYFINPQKYSRPIQGGVKGINSALVERQTVIHSSPVYILDKKGTAKVLHTNPINPTNLAHDIVQMYK